MEKGTDMTTDGIYKVAACADAIGKRAPAVVLGRCTSAGYGVASVLALGIGHET